MYHQTRYLRTRLHQHVNPRADAHLQYSYGVMCVDFSIVPIIIHQHQRQKGLITRTHESEKMDATVT